MCSCCKLLSLPQYQTLKDFQNVLMSFPLWRLFTCYALSLEYIFFLCASDFTSVKPHLIYPDTTAASYLYAQVSFCISIFYSSHCTTLISFLYLSIHFSLKAGTIISSFYYPALSQNLMVNSMDLEHRHPGFNPGSPSY